MSRDKLRAAYDSHASADTFLQAMSASYMRQRGTRTEKTALAAKTKAKQEAKIARDVLMDAAREALAVEGILFPDVLIIVRDALGIGGGK